MRRPIRRILPAFTLAFFLTGATARADDDTERARALFDEAGELERRGQWGAAQEKLRKAIELRETPHLRYALGWALEHDDKLLEARAEYELATKLARRGGHDDVARLAAARTSEIAKATPTATVRVPGGSATGVVVVVDGRSTPLEDDVAVVSVNPGSRVVRAERRGYVANERLVYVPRGATVELELPAPDTKSPQPAVQERPTVVTERTDPARDESNAVPWILVGGGAALVVAGGALLVSSAFDARARDEATARWCAATQCTNGTVAAIPESPEAAAFRRDATDAAERGNTKQAIGFALGGAGLVAAAIGVIVHLRSEREPPVRISGGPTAHGAGASAVFAF